MATLAERISQLTNPAPVFHDPEDDQDETKARLLEEPDVDDEPVVTSSSKLRKRTAALLSDEDPRYAGRRISRSKLKDQSSLQVEGQSDSESESDDDDDGSSKSDVTVDTEDEEEDEEEDNDLANFTVKMKNKKVKSDTDFQFEDDGDYGKYAESFDEEMESKDEESDSEDEEEDDDDEEGGMLLSSALDNTDEKNEGGMKAFSDSSVKEEVAKGNAAKAQLSLWDSMLKGRIELQKVLTLVNRLPQPDTWNQFLEEGGDQYQKLIQEGQKGLQLLLEQLIDLQTALFQQNPETKHVAMDNVTNGTREKTLKKEPINDSDEEITSESEPESGQDEKEKPEELSRPAPSRKRKWNEYPEFIAKRHANFQTYRNETIQKWADKTRIASGRISKSSAVQQSTVKQIEMILMDKGRLVKRTQLKRSDYVVLGKRLKEDEKEEKNDSEPEPEPEPESRLLNRDHLKDYDSEIFDDDDFYHQLLRELIERKTSDISDPVALSRQWLEIQKLRNRVKKNVDTKASKGRKVRYHVHSKLVNFMAPMETGSWADEARDDLFKSLFSKNELTQHIQTMDP